MKTHGLPVSGKARYRAMTRGQSMEYLFVPIRIENEGAIRLPPIVEDYQNRPRPNNAAPQYSQQNAPLACLRSYADCPISTDRGTSGRVRSPESFTWPCVTKPILRISQVMSGCPAKSMPSIGGLPTPPPVLPVTANIRFPTIMIHRPMLKTLYLCGSETP